MKQWFFLFFLPISQKMIAQNVGIGTATPLSRLHVANGVSGASPFSFSPLVIESNSHTYINLLSTAANETAILFGQPANSASGVIMYNNPSTPNGFQFRNNGNLTRMVIMNNGNVGIGTLDSRAALGFGNGTGQKISFFDDGNPSGANYGIGLQSGLLQLHTYTINDDIAFGYGSSGFFTERMRIKGNGNVGIGTANPQYPLDINGRMRLSGTSPNDPGTWLNDAGVDRAFIGLENNNYVGFYGNQGAGWKFSMNTQTGALKINGSEGQAGQTIISNGAAAPSWGSISSWLFNNMYQINQTANLNAAQCLCTPTLPGMSTTDFSLAITTNSKLIISAHVNAKAFSCFGCGSTHITLGTQIYQNGFTFSGTSSPSSEGDIANGLGYSLTTGLRIVDVTPGNYTFRTYIYNEFGPATVEFSAGRLVIVVVPQ